MGLGAQHADAQRHGALVAGLRADGSAQVICQLGSVHAEVRGALGGGSVGVGDDHGDALLHGGGDGLIPHGGVSGDDDDGIAAGGHQGLKHGDLLGVVTVGGASVSQLHAVVLGSGLGAVLDGGHNVAGGSVYDEADVVLAVASGVVAGGGVVVLLLTAARQQAHRHDSGHQKRKNFLHGSSPSSLFFYFRRHATH